MAFDLDKIEQIEKELWTKLKKKLDAEEITLQEILYEVVISQYIASINFELLKEIMSDASDLTATAAAEETDIAAITAAIPGIQSGLNSLAAAVALAQSEEVPQSVVDALTQAQADLHTAVGGLAAIDIPTAAADPDAPVAPPVTPVAPVDPPVTPVTPVTPSAPTDVNDPASGLPLYSQVSGGTTEATFTAVADVTDSAGNPLYTFSGDTAGSAPTGADANYEPFTGTTQNAASPGTTPAS